MEAYAFEELCRAAVPTLHRLDIPIARLGPWEPAQRYWRGAAPELDVVARSVDGERLLVGEVKWSRRTQAVSRATPRPALPRGLGAGDREIVHALFIPEAATGRDETTGAYLVDGEAVMKALR